MASERSLWFDTIAAIGLLVVEVRIPDSETEAAEAHAELDEEGNEDLSPSWSCDDSTEEEESDISGRVSLAHHAESELVLNPRTIHV